MKSIYSVAEARNNLAEIVSLVMYSGATVTIAKYGKPVVKVVKVDGSGDRRAALKEYFGIWKGKRWAARVGKPSRLFRKRNYWS